MATKSDYGSLLLVTTMDKMAKRITNQVGTKKALTAWLRENGRRQIWTGGDRIVEPVRYTNGSVAQWWTGYDVIDPQQGEFAKSAIYLKKHLLHPVVFTKDERDANRGEAQIMSLVGSKIEDAELSMEETMNTAFFGDGTGDGNRRMLGLQAIVEIDLTNSTTIAPTQRGSGTVGTLNRSTDTWWRPWNSAGESTATSGDTLYTAMNPMDKKLTKDGSSWTAGFTTETVLGIWDELLFDLSRIDITKQVSTGNAGFMQLAFNQKPIYADDACTAGALYMLNDKYLTFYILDNENFVLTPEEKATNQFVYYRHVMVGGQLVTSNSSRQGVIHTIT